MGTIPASAVRPGTGLHRSERQIPGIAPAWLQTLSLSFAAGCIAATAVIIADLGRRPQVMWIMNLVWPLTALYSGPFGLAFYFVYGRAAGAPAARRQAPPLPPAKKPFWAVALTGASHCGAGCAVGDLIAEWLVFAAGPFVFGSKPATKYLAAFALAYAVGIFFQYFSIAPMRGLGLRDGIVAAAKADTLSLTAYEIGMFGWMAVVQLELFPGLEPTSWSFWFQMQIAMILGLLTTFPVNWWLIRSGIKESM
jgi:hypothetical protein